MARKIAVGGQNITTEIQSNTFTPVKAGAYEVTIFQVKEGVYKGKNSDGLPNINAQLRISEGQPGTNRRLFTLVPVTPNWKDGKDAFMFYQFFAAVLGISESDFRKQVAAAAKAKDGSLTLPEDHELLGVPITAIVKVVDDEYAYDKAVSKWEDLNDEDAPKPKQSDFQKNEISGFAKKGNGNMSTAKAEAAAKVSGAVKLKEFDLL